MFPIFELPLAVACSRRLLPISKLVYASLHSWQYHREPADFEEMADRVAISKREFIQTLEYLEEEGLLEYTTEPEWYSLIDPPWLEEEAARHKCPEWLTVLDPDGDLLPDEEEEGKEAAL